MKYLSIGAIGLLVIGAIWHANDYRTSAINLMGMTHERTSEDLTKLPNDIVDTVKPSEVVALKDGDTFELEASIVKQTVGNRTVKRLAYNQQIPGPIIKVDKGAKITVNFANNIDQETALHSHGLRGDWRFDGAAPLTQDPIPVGETFTYELEFPDTGIYWYHPHVREDYQQELGLYGNMIVEEADYWNAADQEEYLIFDDFLEDGIFDESLVTHTLMGRFGDTFLINDQEDFQLRIMRGQVTRLFITNVANTRTFDLAFEGSATKLVGGDNGRIENEELIDDLVIAPSERWVVELFYDEAGVFPITHRGTRIGEVIVGPSETDRSAEFLALRSNPGDYSSIRSELSELLAKDPDKWLRLDLEMKGQMKNMMNSSDDRMAGPGNNKMMREHCKVMPEMSGCSASLTETDEAKHEDEGIEWEDDMAMMNRMSTDENIEWIIEDLETGEKNEQIDWSFTQGDLVKIRIFNDDKAMHPMQHPIHFHGQRFVVLARDGIQNGNLQWKDTVLIPKGETVDLLVDMSNPGKWMAHCHIAEHLHSGMMFDFTVE